MSVNLICYCYDPPALGLSMGPTTCHSKIKYIAKYLWLQNQHDQHKIQVQTSYWATY